MEKAIKDSTAGLDNTTGHSCHSRQPVFQVPCECLIHQMRRAFGYHPSDFGETDFLGHDEYGVEF
jgi:hypothetical protein